MSIYGIGTDLVNIERFQSLLQQPQQTLLKRWLQRILTAAELQEWQAKFPQPMQDSIALNQAAAWMAKHYAAKEAFAKAYGTGIGQQLSFQDLTVQHTPAGQPLLAISPKIQQHLARPYHLWISLSDEFPLAQAMVIIELD